MLIDKLNYLVDKNRKANEPGGLLQAYQLTDQFESFQKLGKQSGFLFYVPAWMTSKIDPTTGFVNLFYVKYESVKESQNFVKKFDEVIYNADKDWFEFKFDYSNFTPKAEGSQTIWTVCSYGSRIRHFRNPEQNNEWDTVVLLVWWGKNEKFSFRVREKCLLRLSCLKQDSKLSFISKGLLLNLRYFKDD